MAGLRSYGRRRPTAHGLPWNIAVSHVLAVQGWPTSALRPEAPSQRGLSHVTLKSIYLGLCIVGTVLPISQFLPFLRDHGLDLPLFFRQLFSTPVGGFFGMDVIVSSIVLWVFVLADGRRLGMKHLWAPIAANITVGVSLGLPLFLYMRERDHRREREIPAGDRAH